MPDPAWLTQILETPRTNECIPHQKPPDKSGYGHCRWQGRMTRVHRVVWERANGPIPEGLVVRHDCDNPGCANIRHLRLGTQAQNVADAVSRSRQRGAVGQRNSHNILTPEQARRVRTSPLPAKVFLEEYGISKQTVSAIRKGKIWRHLP